MPCARRGLELCFGHSGVKQSGKEQSGKKQSLANHSRFLSAWGVLSGPSLISHVPVVYTHVRIAARQQTHEYGLSLAVAARQNLKFTTLWDMATAALGSLCVAAGHSKRAGFWPVAVWS